MEAHKSKNSYDVKKATEVIKSLQKMAKYFRIVAMFTMLLMVLAMIGGFLIFYAAGEIVARENLNSYQRAIGVQNSIQSAQAELESFAGPLKELGKEKTHEISAKLEKLESKMKSIEQKQKSGLDKHISVVSMITRISAGIILIFLVQILAKMYRYNVRLATFYESRANALNLAANLDSDSIQRTADLLGPEA
jgi:predicted PurR-regulated permease PerM